MLLVPDTLRVNDLPSPVGTPARPYFGWHLTHPQGNQIQTGYQIVVAPSPAQLDSDGDALWDSGRVTSGRQNHIVYTGPPLCAATRYFWMVRVWDRDGADGLFSDAAPFVTGLLADDDWAGAHWIRRDTDEADDNTYYRRTLRVPDQPVTLGLAFVTAVHKYDLFINGHRVAAGPAYHYPQYQYYNAYDVTPFLVPGATNTLALLTHWFGAGQGRPASARGLLMKLIVEFADGSRLTEGTDADWKQRRAGGWLPGQPSRNDEGVGYVEVIDAAQLVPGWNLPGHDDSAWPTAVNLGPHPTPPWTGPLQPDLSRIVEHEVPPAAVTQRGSGCYVADLGRVHAGRPRLVFSGGVPGTRVDMQGGFTLAADGTVDPNTCQNTDMRAAALLSGGEFEFKPQEYLGMRYWQVDGAPMPVTPENFSFVKRHTALEETRASFASSNDTLNQVWDLMRGSLYLGSQEQFIDTPTREKGGFLVDSANESLAAMAVFSERVLTRRTLHEFLQSMDHFWSSPADRGRMNAVYPNGDGARDIPDFTLAFLPWAWEYYWQTGDEHFLSEQYFRLKRIAEYARRHHHPRTGLLHRLTGGAGPYQYGIVDWPPSMRYGYDMAVDARTVVNALAYAAYVAVARMAAALGFHADAEQCTAWADSLRLAINARLVNVDDLYVDGLHIDGSPSTHASQHANALPLALDLVPNERRAAVVDHVKGLRVSMGMVTVGWLIRALGEADEGEHLLDVYTRSDWDGWARCLARGATCTWESWDADARGGLSLSHPWGAVGLVGLQQYVLGVRALAPQYEHVQIKPLAFGEQLTWAEGRVPTDRGDLHVRWEYQAGRVALRMTLPANVRARVCVARGAVPELSLTVDGQPVAAEPEGRYLVVDGIGSGSHIIERGP